MRRKDREITDIDEKIDIIRNCKVCRLALSDNDAPYIIPLNYGFDFKDGVLNLFFHSAKEGKKIDIIRKNNKACFEADCDNKLITASKACNHGYSFRSIIGFGAIFIIENKDEKIDGLNKIMKHQTNKNFEYNYSENELNGVAVYKMVVNEFTGKKRETEG